MSISHEQTVDPARNMKEVLFVQGGGKDVHDGWDNRLVASLERELGPGYAVAYPRMPDEGHPRAKVWKKAFGAALARCGDGAVFVAHSVGAAIALDYLAGAALARRLSGVFLVAPPFIGDGGWPSDELRPTNELAAALAEFVAATPLHLYFGDQDQTVPLAHGRLFAATVPRARIAFLNGRDHQLNDDLSQVARDIEQLPDVPG